VLGVVKRGVIHLMQRALDTLAPCVCCASSRTASLSANSQATCLKTIRFIDLMDVFILFRKVLLGTSTLRYTGRHA
jgi:hypothetical protein